MKEIFDAYTESIETSYRCILRSFHVCGELLLDLLDTDLKQDELKVVPKLFFGNFAIFVGIGFVEVGEMCLLLISKWSIVVVFVSNHRGPLIAVEESIAVLVVRFEFRVDSLADHSNKHWGHLVEEETEELFDGGFELIVLNNAILVLVNIFEGLLGSLNSGWRERCSEHREDSLEFLNLKLAITVGVQFLLDFVDVVGEELVHHGGERLLERFAFFVGHTVCLKIPYL